MIKDVVIKNIFDMLFKGKYVLNETFESLISITICNILGKIVFINALHIAPFIDHFIIRMYVQGTQIMEEIKYVYIEYLVFPVARRIVPLPNIPNINVNIYN